MPLFSVIIPLYNKEEFISECLESALGQSFEDYEIVIVNDGSTDESVKIVEQYRSEKIRLFHQDNQGASKARNNAVEYAKGKYLAFLDADDIWTPEHLQCLKESIDTYPNSGIYANNYLIKYSDTLTVPAKLNIRFSGAKPLKLKDFFKASLQDTVVWTSACCIEKSKFIAYGMFNPIYLSSQDLDMWIRIALKEPIIIHPEQTMIYNHSIENSLGKIEDNDARFILLSSFKQEEKHNPSLKTYLDQKRYGLAIRTKINGELEIHEKTKQLIDITRLNAKQKILLSMPRYFLKILNSIRPMLIKNSLYLRFFKG